jgi:hypothetical protein
VQVAPAAACGAASANSSASPVAHATT